MKITIITMFLLIPVAYFFSWCSGKKKVYYVYGTANAAADFFPNDKKSPTYKTAIVTDSTIKDRSLNVPLFLDITFNGEYQYYPKGIKIEVFKDGNKIASPDLADITVVAVLDGRVNYFKREDSIYEVTTLIKKVKEEKSIPDSIHYFNVSGHFKRIPLGNTTLPEKIKIKVKLSWENGGIENEYVFEQGEVEYAKPKNRPFG